MAMALTMFIFIVIVVAIMAVVLAIVLYFVPNVFWHHMPERDASRGPTFVRTPVEIADSSISQVVRDTRVTLPYSTVARVDFLRVPEKESLRNGHWEFWVVRVQDARGAAVFLERVRVWWAKPLILIRLGSPSNRADWTDVRGILQTLLPRLPAAAVVDPQVEAYAAIGQYPNAPTVL